MKKKIFFTGGGTGGHVYPALAIIEELNIKNEYDIFWIGSKSGMEYKIVTGAGIPFYSIPSGKLRRYFSILNFIDLFKIFMGFIVSLYVLTKNRPDLIFSKGGYVTVPPIIISKILRIRSITHESDMTPGLATNINSKFVDKILVPYEKTKTYIPSMLKDRVLVTGNPIRKEFYTPNKDNGKRIMGFKNSKPTILVLGGSLGAKEINDLLFAAMDKITADFNVYHQMGSKNYIEINNDNYKTVPFIDNSIADIISASNIVISRSGASAVWEFATVGTPSIFIPLTAGSRGDQILNANYSMEKGLSIVLTGDDLVSDKLIESIYKLSSSYENNAVDEFRNYNASIKISNIIRELL